MNKSYFNESKRLWRSRRIDKMNEFYQDLGCEIPGGSSPYDNAIYTALNGLELRYGKADGLTSKEQTWGWTDAMKIASEVSESGTCPRRKVGAIFVREDGLILGRGFNSAPPGLPTCEQAGCVLEQHDNDTRCIRTLHAEKYARLDLDEKGISPLGLTLVITCRPCHVCARDLAAWKIARVVYAGEDPKSWPRDVLLSAGIELLRID